MPDKLPGQPYKALWPIPVMQAASFLIHVVFRFLHLFMFHVSWSVRGTATPRSIKSATPHDLLKER